MREDIVKRPECMSTAWRKLAASRIAFVNTFLETMLMTHDSAATSGSATSPHRAPLLPSLAQTATHAFTRTQHSYSRVMRQRTSRQWLRSPLTTRAASPR